MSRLAEQHLSRKLTSRVEGDVVVQSVFRTFFRRLARGEFQIDSRAQLWRLLVKITVHKARMQARYHTAAARRVDVEQQGDDVEWLQAFVDHEPGPEEIATLMDQIERLLRGLPTIHCQVLDQRLQGNSVAEIASRLTISRQTARAWASRGTSGIALPGPKQPLLENGLQFGVCRELAGRSEENSRLTCQKPTCLALSCGLLHP